MKIARISVFQKNLPLAKPYRLSGGRLLFTELDATFVKVETACGIAGWGEGCPWGHTYLPAHGGGIRAAMPLLAAAVLGMEPRGLTRLNDAMDAALPGHFYAKAPLDIACWDIFGQSVSMPICELLGGARGKAPIVSSTSTAPLEEMLKEADEWRERGYFRHSVKIGGADLAADIGRIRRHEAAKKPGERIIYDANRSWTPAQAMMVMNAVADLPGLSFEQPCETLDFCAKARAQTTQPISIDERAETAADVVRIARDRIAEIVNIKINRVGGLTKARVMRDIALAGGIDLLAMESGGSAVADTAAVHLAQTVPPPSLVGTWLCHDMLGVDITDGKSGARNQNGYAAAAPDKAGLGVAPDEKQLGEPVAVYE